MKIRNKQTGRIHEVLEGTLYAKNIFEEIDESDHILVGEPTIEYEIEKPGVETEPAKEQKKVFQTTTRKKRTTKKTKKGVKNGTKTESK